MKTVASFTRSECRIMYTKKKYSFRDMLLWTRVEILVFCLVALVATLLFEVAGLRWLRLPWTPIALIGTAVAFLIGFQNNAAYGRAWEARKIWGGIVNQSRTWAMMIGDMVSNEHAMQPATDAELLEYRSSLIHRHIAWVTALRHAMREKRPWEMFAEHHTNKEWYRKMHIPERDHAVEDDLRPLLAASELQVVLKRTNTAAAILALQSGHLRALKERGLVWEFSFLELEGQLAQHLTLQGKSERIKNFPYPRQYASLSYDLVHVFVLLLPFGVIPEFSRLGEELGTTFPMASAYFVWLAIPFSVIISWVFHTMQRIGIVGENPFEGSANDVPISTIARGIEIDLREMNSEDPSTIPEPLPVVDGVQM